MPDNASLDLVRSTLLDTLGALDAPVSFSDALRIPLTQPGKVLGNLHRPLWVQLVLAACAAAGGDFTIGARVAAGVEFFMAALDVLDEIEDDDFSPTVEAVGMPQALNAATGLLLLGQRTLLDVPARPGLPTPVDFALALAQGGLAATKGQHRDLDAVGADVGSPDAALETARWKAGSLGRAACCLGAMVGTGNGPLLDLYGHWGEHYGIAAQLANDLHDALNTTEKSDIARQKATLPLLFHRRTAISGEARSVPRSGALHFTWTIVEIERQACRELADELAAQGQDVALLRRFVP